MLDLRVFRGFSDGVDLRLDVGGEPIGNTASLHLDGRLGQTFTRFTGDHAQGVDPVCNKQYSHSWAINRHAQAYYTLCKREKTEDTKCVGCHFTDLGHKGAFELGDHRSPFTDVTCESCHSASGPHDGKSVAASSTCVGCHNAEHSINFSVAKGLPHIDHYAANTLSETELRARVAAIADGTAEKPLLALRDGDAVGTAAGKSCHKKQHAALAKAPHARAMKGLPKADANNPSCVRCHATAKTFGGPPSAELSGYRVDESVGCESCHGPGQTHVTNPRKDNIVGLGDSCPECVIEAICTSCHTPEWDADWELQKRLDAIPH